MSGFIRRVVAGHDKNGKAVVLSDGIAPHLKTNPLRPGHRSTDIWKTSSTPVIIKASEEDPTMQGPRTIHPPKGGTVLRIAELQPETWVYVKFGHGPKGDMAAEVRLSLEGGPAHTN